jgi:hypothetical protein
MSARSSIAWPRFAALLALLALALLVYQPVCETYALHVGEAHGAFLAQQGGDAGADCCTEILPGDSGPVVKAVTSSADSPALALAALVLMFVAAPLASRHRSGRARSAPPFFLSYYARTARILR